MPKDVKEPRNIDSLFISWQTLNKDSFLSRGVELDYEEFKDKILNFTKKNKGKTEINISIMIARRDKLLKKSLMGKNFKHLLNQNINKIIKNFKLSSKQIHETSLKDKFKLGNNLFLNIDEFMDWGGQLSGYSKNFKRKPTDKGNCGIMSDGPLILANRDVSICCVDYDGNVTVDSTKEKKI